MSNLSRQQDEGFSDDPRIVEVVELPAPRGDQEQPREGRAERDREGKQEDHRAQRTSARATRRSTPNAPTFTRPLDNGINKAATRGFTNPKAAAVTATAAAARAC